MKCPYNDIIITEALWQNTAPLHNYDEPYNLFDWTNQRKIRSISLLELDCTIDTEEDFKKKIDNMCGLDTLVIRNDRPSVSNVYVKTYFEATIKAYIYRFRNAGIQCFIDYLD